MKRKSKTLRSAVCGLGAGVVNGLFGAGGGMVLIPLLSRLVKTEEEALFPTSVAVILPICVVSLAAHAVNAPLPWAESLPYLIGSALGGIPAAIYGKKIPVIWLHRAFGVLVLWGGIRYLC